MQLHLDTSEISDLDRKIIAALHEHFGGKTAAPAAKTPIAETEKPAAKNTKPAAAKAEAKVEDPAADGPTLEDAVAAATALVSKGKAPHVKAALESVGAKRVSELSSDSIADFLAALPDA
jgi:hypothetical protein